MAFLYVWIKGNYVSLIKSVNVPSKVLFILLFVHPNLQRQKITLKLEYFCLVLK